jgi:hypothetical protein
VTRLPSTNGRPHGGGGPVLIVPRIGDDEHLPLPAEVGVERPTPTPRRVAAARVLVRRDARAVYGGLLVTALITVQWHAATVPEFVAFTVLVTVGVFWLTHVWAEVVERRLERTVTRAEVLRVARREASMVVAAVPPVLALGLARTGLVTVDAAIVIALVVCIAQLFFLGLAIGRAAGRGWPGAVGLATVECLMGALLVGLKVVVVH